MRKRNPAATVTVFLSIITAFLFVFEINLSSVFRLSSAPTQAKQVISCNRSHKEYDLCSITGATIVDPVTSTFFLVDPTISGPGSIVEKIKPYPRKWENFPMKRIKELAITSGPSGPECEVQHNSPAIVFNVVLVVSKARDWWLNRYKNPLHVFSSHPIVTLDNDPSAHCFPSATLGFMSYGFMALMPNSSQTLLYFRGLLDKAFGHHDQYSIFNPPLKSDSPPQLVFMTRSKGIGGEILNQDEGVKVAKEIGFDIILFEPTGKISLQQAYGLINSSYAMVGMHGATLTHSLFLRPGSAFMQVMSLGIDWVGKMCFGEPARAIGIQYIEYKIKVEQRSLVEKYDKNDMVIKDPASFQGRNWSSDVMNIYLKEQNVKLDLVRFRDYLMETLAKQRHSWKKWDSPI
ncbi:hypothetical protein ES319_A03G114000v1 [Gossypium barbadense]|uniref:Glycosyltransferase 61 catalytic domain-containing protein n=1 Tax=Gossypium barbadense TaxID=3634 RepID=A0A5J5WDP7_GOSBA|nr:hypothetical protein ES319_A03G114000v1 [Gossypium barbadense]